jgi:anaerobic selenocysteine-containing dehydrogenase
MKNVSVHKSFCRACINSCPTLVEVRDGRLYAATGDPDNATFAGYSCIKGRAQPALHNHPQRLLHSQKRLPDGRYTAISSATALDEIAERLQRILEHFGPRSLASYAGTFAFANATSVPFLSAFMQAVGSTMVFTPITIDKPGKPLARALHGTWMAPLQGYQDPDVALIIGANPFKSYYGVACGHPAKWLGEQLARGMELLVIDPRRSDLAKRATLFLQPRPGTDPAILACLIHVILAEELFDHEFVHENARNLEQLREAVAPFTPQLVGALADVDAADLVAAARTFARAGRGYVACGVGPGFSKSSTLVEYLALVLETLCGHWLRAGEKVARTTTLLPSAPCRAQAQDPTPAYGLGEVLRVGGLTETTAGMPTGALADEILLDGEGQVRALFSLGGNPVLAWPDQLKAIEALEALDLLVQFDPWMSATARMADYVIAPPLQYEVPAMTTGMDFAIAAPTYYGPAESYAQYSPAIVAPPAGSDVIAEWEFLYGLAQRLGLALELRGPSLSPHASGSGYLLDMKNKPDGDALLELLAGGGRVPLEEVKRHPSGATFPDPPQFVADKEPGWTGRLELANDDMMRDLANELPVANAPTDGGAQPANLPFRLIGIRVQSMYNSTLNDASTNRGRAYNSAHMHPDDLRRLGLRSGDVARIASARAMIDAIVEADDTLRHDLVAMAHGFGDAPSRDSEMRAIGSPVGRLLDGADIADPYVGMPRINDIPVDVRPLPPEPG